MARQRQRGNVFDRLSSRGRPQTISPRPKHNETANTSDVSDKDRNDKETGFDPHEPFLLSDLVSDLDSRNGNYFQFPPGAHAFLRGVLSSAGDDGVGVDFRFVPMGRSTETCGDGDDDGGGKGNSRDETKVGDDDKLVAFISSCPQSRDIHINLGAYPPPRVGEAICHELLHHLDFRTSGFRPTRSLVYCDPAGLSGAAAAAAKASGVCKDAPTKAFHPMIAKLVNLISHEYVKTRLEEFGYSEPFVPAMNNQLASLRFMLHNLEATMCSLSQQLAKVGRKKPRKVGIYSLQSMYEDLIIVVLMDELLFMGEFAEQIDDTLLTGFQHVLDYVLDCTSGSSDGRLSFRGVYRRVGVVAGAVRDACKRYRTVKADAIVGDADTRYALLLETLNAAYDAVGLQFVLLTRRKDEAPSIRIETAPGVPAVLQEDASFILDGEYLFADAKAFSTITLKK